MDIEVIDGKDTVTIKSRKPEKRDPTYSLQWDCIILKVQNTLFRVPQTLLLTHSQYFRDLFKLPSLQSAEGTSSENPVVVVSITVKEFRHFLQLILPLATENLEAVRPNNNSGWKDEWISVLNVSTHWHCVGLRKIAIHELESNSHYFGIFFSQSNTGSSLTAKEKILLGRANSICSWVEAGYMQLVKSGDISDNDMRKIGPEVSFRLMRISRDIQMQKQTSSALEETIKKTFQAELQAIAATEEAFI